MMVPNVIALLLLPIVASSFTGRPTARFSSCHHSILPRQQANGIDGFPFLPSIPLRRSIHHKLLHLRPSPSSLVLHESLSSSTAESSSTAAAVKTTNERRMLYPSVGDVVRYYDLDGGNQKGQMMIGKISYISKNAARERSGWTLEVIPLDDINRSNGSNGGAAAAAAGGSYYADYPNYQTRKSKTILRDLFDNVSPVACVFVNSENAYKVSWDKITQQPIVRQEQYDVEGYEGPFATQNLLYNSNIRPINTNVVLDDAARYDQLKMELLRNTALFGVVGSIVTYIVSSINTGSDSSSSSSSIINYDGIENAIIYLSGVLANIGYLYFLSMKTDTMATTTTTNKFGKVITNLRFVTPVLPLIAVSLYNELYHSHDDFQSATFKLVTTQQFFDVTIGFLSYRIPLFFTQIQEAFKDDKNTQASTSTSKTTYQPMGTATKSASSIATPGKVSLVSTMDAPTNSKPTAVTDGQQQSTMKPLFPMKFNGKTKQNELLTIFLISGPSATGRSELVQRFVKESTTGQFVVPTYIDRYKNATQFDYIDQRNGFIYQSNDGRYGLTRESFIQDVQSLEPTKSVLILDTDVDFAIQLSQMGGGGIRLVAVWVTLGSIDAFEQRIGTQYDRDQRQQRSTNDMDNMITLPPDNDDEGRKIEIRTRTTRIVQEIEMGITSGIFEFTIINDNDEQSLKELRDASKYCFV